METNAEHAQAPDRLTALEMIQRALDSLERGHFGTARAQLIRASNSLLKELHTASGTPRQSN
jgi:hypothetical protein